MFRGANPVEIRVADVIAEHLGLWIEEICPGDKLSDDLGLDSLERVELVAKLEKKLEIDIPEDAVNVATIGELVACVEKLLSAPAS
jgi:acyl carrier protein